MLQLLLTQYTDVTNISELKKIVAVVTHPITVIQRKYSLIESDFVSCQIFHPGHKAFLYGL